MAVKKIFSHHCYITPAWSPDGSKMLTLENDTQTHAHLSYPHYKLLCEQTDTIYMKDEDLIPGFGMVYLKNGLAIVQNANCRHFLFDPITMERLGEIVIQGYEPVPANQIYKNLKDDNTLCSRIVYFNRIGNLLAARTGDKDDDQAIIFIDENIDYYLFNCILGSV